MSVFEKIQADLKAARLAKDAFTADTLRTLIGDIQLQATRPSAKPVEDITQSKLKSFSDSAQEFHDNTGDEAIKADKVREIAIYASYRPTVMSDDSLRAALIAQFGAELAAKQKGPMMGFLKVNYAGQYDGKVAGDIVDALIAKSLAEQAAKVA